jgi:hypothetical protein
MVVCEKTYLAMIIQFESFYVIIKANAPLAFKGKND